MAVPKKRTGKSAQGHRRSNWKATKPETTKCPNCGTLALTHTVCEACGFYKGKAVSRKSPQFVEATLEAKPVKAKKAATKKAKVKTEAPVETAVETTETVAETVVEEVKEEATEAKTEEEK